MGLCKSMSGNYVQEKVKTLHLGGYVGCPENDGDQRVYVQTGVYRLSNIKVGEDPTGMSRDTNFEYLGKMVAGIAIVCTKGLEQIVVHPGSLDVKIPSLQIEDSEDLRNVAKGIAEFHRYKIGVRYSEELLELPVPKKKD